MALSNAERQARYKQRLKDAAMTNYEVDVLKAQIAQLETALNEARRKLELSEIQLPRSAYKSHR